MDQRALPGLVTGLTGFTFGIAGAVVGSPLATVVAAACALGAGASSLAMLRRAHDAEQQTAVVSAELAVLRQLELSTPNRARSIIDSETGLPDGRFFEVGLENRVAAARRHLWPVTVVLLDVSPAAGDGRHPGALASLALLINQTLREADTVCRIGTTTFALILEDTSEAGGVWAAERVQFAGAREKLPTKRLAAGVASYPAHGLEAHEILQQARAALARACAAEADGGLGRVEVAQSGITWEAN